jgi:SAM-dependent methyltransferase
MHDSSMDRMREFVQKYLDINKETMVLDVGSWQNKHQKSYRILFNSCNWKYYGMDIQEGDNVDIVAKSPYNWELECSYDVIISGQCIEHVKDTKEWIKQIDKHLKPEGMVCIIAPWQWRQHRYPVDCWRILPDGMEFLLKDVCGFDIIENFIKECDCVGIARKPKDKS